MTFLTPNHKKKIQQKIPLNVSLEGKGELRFIQHLIRLYEKEQGLGCRLDYVGQFGGNPDEIIKRGINHVKIVHLIWLDEDIQLINSSDTKQLIIKEWEKNAGCKIYANWTEEKQTEWNNAPIRDLQSFNPEFHAPVFVTSIPEAFEGLILALRGKPKIPKNASTAQLKKLVEQHIGADIHTLDKWIRKNVTIDKLANSKHPTAQLLYQFFEKHFAKK